MTGRSEFLPQNRREWLLAIGQRLRAEYAAVGDPIPERLAALVARLEAPAGGTPAGTDPPMDPAAAHIGPDQEQVPDHPRPPVPESRGEISAAGALLSGRAFLPQPYFGRTSL